MDVVADSAASIFSYSRSRSNSSASQSSALEQGVWQQQEGKSSPLRQVLDALEDGDEHAVRRYVSSGVDVNGEDEEGRSVIGYLVLGTMSFKDTDLSDEVVSRALAASRQFRLRILRYLRTRNKFSLYTLNAPLDALGGLTPLGMSAYLSRLDFVKVLLEGGASRIGSPSGEEKRGECDGAVLVDGIDMHRATPIMYAARDGHLDIVQYLLDNGARADAADCHHRSVLFYAATHPACLWSCERVLRLKRARALLRPRTRRRLKLNFPLDPNEYMTRTSAYEPPSFAASPSMSSDHADVQASLRPLVTAIRRGDVAAVHNLLFPSPQQQAEAPPPVPPKDRTLGNKHSCSSLSSRFASGAAVNSESEVVRPRQRSSSLPFPRFDAPALSASTSALPSIAQEPPPPPAPATLVNLRDSCGWAPIHYALAVPRPSARVLDALYLAGADLALYTGNNQDSPLHCLARADPTAPTFTSPSLQRSADRHGNFSAFQLYAFVTHAVRDLGAPLDAKDLDGNTPLHIAAAEGYSLDVLMALLDCDTDGEVRRMKNSQGFTAFDVAKAEFRFAFDSEEAFMRPASAASVRTVRPSASRSSFVSASSASSTLSSSSSSFDGEELEESEQFPPRRSDEADEVRSDLSSVIEAQKVVNELKHLAEELEKAERESEEREFDLESGPPVRGMRGLGKIGSEGDDDRLDLDDMETRLHSTRKGASDILERFRILVDFALEDLEKAGVVRIKLLGLIEHLERRVQKSSVKEIVIEDSGRWELKADDGGLFVEVEDARSLDRESGALTPTLTHSAGSSSAGSFASLASFSLSTLSENASNIRDLAEVEITQADTNRRAEDIDWRDPFQIDADVLPPFDLDNRQSYQKRSRSSSVLSAVSPLDSVAAPLSPLENGIELVSVPPVVALEATAPTSPINLSFNSPNRADTGTSWLGPYVRRTNSQTFQQHLENLMEIERTLFGDEDDERELEPQGNGGEPYGCVNADEDMDWREGVHLIEDEIFDTETILEVVADVDSARRNAVYVEEGNFLDMFVNSSRARTPSPPRSATPERPLTVLDILGMVKCEVSQLDEITSESEKRIERAQRYLTQAEHLTGKVFQAKEHALQAARLSQALRELCGEAQNRDLDLDRSINPALELDLERCTTPELCAITRAPTSSPISTRSTATLNQFLATSSPSRNASAYASAQISRQPSMQSLLAVPAPLPLLSTAVPAPVSTIARAAEEDDVRQLRRLLTRKIPARLEGVLDSVDRAGTWAGILQSVTHKFQARH